MTGSLLLAGLVAWVSGMGCDLAFGPRSRAGRGVPYVVGALGGVLVTVAGVRCVLQPAQLIGLGSSLGVGRSAIRLDGLAGMFLTLTASLSVAVSGCMWSWTQPDGRSTRRGPATGYLLLLVAVTVVIVAADAFTFLFAWETVTVAFYLLTSVGRRSRQYRASWLTLGTGKVGGAALLLGFLLLAASAGSDSFAAWSHVGPGVLHGTAYTLVVVGFGAKIGMVPFQVWLPAGYSAAPGPSRAAMAALAANVGFYGLWRFLGLLGRPPDFLVIGVLVLGGVTALLGVVFAAVQPSLNRVIAYSSIENAGIILVGYGVALAGSATKHPQLVAVGLLAASLQVLAHAVAKAGLFSSAAFFESDHGTDTLEELRGVGRRHRASGVSFALGAVTLAGLPPTIGFVSEWFILEALLQEFRVHVLALRLAMAFAGALVALTVGVAALAFIRLIGLTILSRPLDRDSTEGEVEVHDGGIAGRAGLMGLAACCLGLAAFAPFVVRFIADGLSPVVPRTAVAGALRSPWVLQPVFANFSILSPSWLFVAMPVGFGAVALGTVVLSRGAVLRPRRVPAWRSAAPELSGPDRYGPFAYANIVRHVLGNVLGARRETVAVDPTGVVEQAALGAIGEPLLEVRSTVVEPVESYLYRPVRVAYLWVVGGAKRLQSGRLDAYVAYMLVALIVLLALVASLK